jgi:hypothetical protein
MADDDVPPGFTAKMGGGGAAAPAAPKTPAAVDTQDADDLAASLAQAVKVCVWAAAVMLQHPSV